MPGAQFGSASEAVVAALAIAGDDAAFEELIRRRQGAIRNLLRRLTRDAALADDLSQQAFVRAWSSIRTLRSPSAFAAWLRALAINCWRQHLRRTPQEVAMQDTIIPDVAAPASAAERRDLDAALAQLSNDVRLCVVLSYDEGMSHGEISESLGMPLGTVKSNITRGAARLRELLHAYSPEEREDANRAI